MATENTANEAKSAPDYIIANNPHAAIVCGPVHPESIDDKRDLTIATSSRTEVIYGKNGNKIEHIQGYSAETCGHNVDGEQKGAVAKAILAENGDICLTAESGDIRLKAKNLYVEIIGEDNKGNIVMQSNGQVNISAGDDVKIAGGDICIKGEKSINLRTNFQVRVVGKFTTMKPNNLFGNLAFGSWKNVIAAVTDSCK